MTYCERKRRNARRWYYANLERAKKSHRAYREANRKALREYFILRYAQNRQRYAAYWKRHAIKFREKNNARKKLWRINNPEKVRVFARDYAARNRHRMTEYNHRKRVSKRLVDCSQKIKILLLDRFCHWCCCKLTSSNRTIDHVLPFKLGGLHIPDNLVSACITCNCSKGERPVGEWLKRFPLGK
jgi:hypothetical protein